MPEIEVDAYGIPEEEVEQYIKRAPAGTYHMTIIPDGDFVDIVYDYEKRVPFERIRRITGYLVGTMDRWNDAKKAEEMDRVKHSV